MKPFWRIDVSYIPPEGLQKLPNRLWPFMWFFMRQVKKTLFLLAAINILITILFTASAYFVKYFVDLLGENTADRMAILQDILWAGAAYVFICVIAQSGFWRMGSYLHARTYPAFVSLVRRQLGLYMNAHAFSYFQNDFAGRLSSKVIETPTALSLVVRFLFGAFAYQITRFFISFILLSLAGGLFQFVILGSLGGVYVWLLKRHLPDLQQYSKNAAEATSKVRGQHVDTLTNILPVKLFAQGKVEDRRFLKVLKNHADVTEAKELRFYQFYKKLDILMKCVWVLPPAYALYAWVGGGVSTGGVALVLTLSVELGFLLWNFSFKIAEFFAALGQVEEGMETITKAHQVIDHPRAKKLILKKADVAVDALSFSYGQKDIFKELNLTIPQGQKVGLIGRSGAGKSTLVNLLLRLYDVQEGKILISGQDITKVTQESLRQHIGMVTQEPALFHRSVLENIRYGRPDASEEDVIKAAKKAHAHSFIKDLPNGYNTLVGERGVKLSGGQRQRIALARVILANAPILILDEATSALDSEVEAAIQEEMATLMKGKTVIAIAHRLSTIKQLDRLIVLDKGKIVEDGTHQSLLRKKGHYYRLWQRQSGGFI